MDCGLLALSALAGVAVGVLSGLLGIGGGMIMVPLFRLGYGMAAIQATATSLLGIIPTSITGCITHIKNRTCVPLMGVAAGIGGAFTSPLGVLAASTSPGWAIMGATAACIVYSAATMLKKTFGSAVLPNSGRVDAAAESGGTGTSSMPWWKATWKQMGAAAAAGLLAGFMSGYAGVGGGFIMVPLFISLANLPMKKASGTSLIGIVILAIPGVITQVMLGNCNLLAGLALAAGSIPGAVLGANLVKHIPERTLRLIFSGMLIVTAFVLVGNELAAGM